MAIPAQVIALCASLSYACVLVTSRRGMQYSTPKTVTLISLIVHTASLWTAVLFTGGIPPVDTVAVYVFIVAGMLQPIIRLCTYTGVHRVGASRSGPIRSTHPMFGVFVAMTVLGESATIVTLLGVVSVVCGIVLITWKPAEEVLSFRWWEFLFPLTAALLAGIVHPMRRYAWPSPTSRFFSPRWWASSRWSASLPTSRSAVSRSCGTAAPCSRSSPPAPPRPAASCW